MHHVKEVFRHVRVPVDFEEVPLNVKTASETMIDQAALAIKRNGVGLKGNIDTNHNNPASYSVNVRLL
jgi:isocitrate dehydrogenase (NAD+)